ncbi:MAG: phosphoribosylformylglycinamidine synthase [Candidatus Pelethousia sp.]|nr:phosphoribosylformylglycinamidine synthase [Candidatus Pelethousia sp.]
MVYRIYVERKTELAQEAQVLIADLRGVLGIESLTNLRIFNRYDVEGIDSGVFSACRYTVFAEPQTDVVYDALPQEGIPFAVEYLPGQYDQRADAAGQCIALLSQTAAPLVRTARVFVLYGNLCQADIVKIKAYLINPVECREAGLMPVGTLALPLETPPPVPVLEGFTALDNDGLSMLIARYGLAMDLEDLLCCRAHFLEQRRDPTLTEIKLVDTYWSDHCRHTTFQTELDQIEFHDERAQKSYETYLGLRHALGATKPITLMDMATIAARFLRAQGKLKKLDDSAEINACTVKTEIQVDGETQPWLVLFKNETHNHPTEIEPFGGAATCIGGAIRDPLSGRAFVHQAMRLTGAADPRRPFSQTLPGKLPQRKLTATAAAGYSSYGNQIGLATGLVDEIYHEGFLAKRMEIGAVIGAAPAENVRRETPQAGDVVVLLGGKTGRDGCGGATGSSKAHTESSLLRCGAEVQKGNAPEERKLQRFFRNPQASRLIKRCNDFGAGGVSVAIGELADGVSINLDAIPRKYAGLDGTELAISESQERMAAVVAARDAENFLALAEAENLSATVVAEITREPRLAMHWRGRCVVDLPRSFIDSNGARKHAKALVDASQPMPPQSQAGFAAGFSALVRNLNTCSKRGLSERFDSTVGAYTVLMPFGGKRQRTPPQAMVAKLPVERGETDACTAMAWGYDPFLSETSPYSGAYAAVVSSVAKLVATGTSLQDCYLTFQEYFGKPGTEPARWGKPAASLLGALEAQLGLGIAAIGGKDSMSGSFESMDVPPTLVSFAVALCNAQTVISPEFKQPGSQVVLLAPQYRADGMPEMESLKAIFSQVQALTAAGKALAVYTPTGGGIAEAVFKMCMGNGLGFAFDASMECGALFKPGCGAFVIELKEDCHLGLPLGVTLAERVLAWRETRMPLDELEAAYEGALEDIFPADIRMPAQKVETITFHGAGRMKPRVKNGAIPRVLIPVFPGTNCEYESARAVERGGAKAEVVVINTLSPAALQSAIREFAARLANSQALFLPGGFSNGDEPDGSGKFIAAFLRNPLIAEELMKLLEVRDGLVLGICNGFQALMKLGLLPYGRMMEPPCASPTLTYNAIGRHQSRLVRIRVSSNLSPWLLLADVGKVYTVPISHGEGRFLCPPAAFSDLAKNGQIAAQYVDADGKPSMQSDINPNGSFASVEAITSPDGRILGKMGHSERIGKDLYKNVPGVFDMRLFESAVEYFK